MEPGLGHRALDTDDDGGRALHARLLRRDPTATVDLAETCLGPLVAWLRRAFRHEDDALLETVATDLILKFGVQPEQYDPDRSSLPAYLRMAARRDVGHARDKERRRSSRLTLLEDVELQPPSRNTLWLERANPADIVAEALSTDRVEAVRAHFDEHEWEVVQLIGEGERRTEVFAELLGLESSPRAERDRAVKRVKDRLKKRLQRVWRTLYGDG